MRCQKPSSFAKTDRRHHGSDPSLVLINQLILRITLVGLTCLNVLGEMYAKTCIKSIILGGGGVDGDVAHCADMPYHLQDTCPWGHGFESRQAHPTTRLSPPQPQQADRERQYMAQVSHLANALGHDALWDLGKLLAQVVQNLDVNLMVSLGHSCSAGAGLGLCGRSLCGLRCGRHSSLYRALRIFCTTHKHKKDRDSQETLSCIHKVQKA